MILLWVLVSLARQLLIQETPQSQTNHILAHPMRTREMLYSNCQSLAQIVSLTYYVMPSSVKEHVQDWSNAPGEPSVPDKPRLLVSGLIPQVQATGGLGLEGKGGRELRWWLPGHDSLNDFSLNFLTTFSTPCIQPSLPLFPWGKVRLCVKGILSL